MVTRGLEGGRNRKMLVKWYEVSVMQVKYWKSNIQQCVYSEQCGTVYLKFANGTDLKCYHHAHTETAAV